MPSKEPLWVPAAAFRLLERKDCMQEPAAESSIIPGTLNSQSRQPTMANQHTTPAALVIEDESETERSNKVTTFPSRNVQEVPASATDEASTSGKSKIVWIVVAIIAALVVGWAVMRKPAAAPTEQAPAAAASI